TDMNSVFSAASVLKIPPPSSVFRLLSSVFRPPSSLLCSLFSVLCLIDFLQNESFRIRRHLRSSGRFSHACCHPCRFSLVHWHLRQDCRGRDLSGHVRSNLRRAVGAPSCGRPGAAVLSRVFTGQEEALRHQSRG